MTTMTTTPRASIVICTHRPDALLAEVLRSLATQDKIADAEVLIIDNATTPAVRIDPDMTMNLRIVHEPRVGLAHARNRGIAEARSDLILFVDDDAIPEAGWLQAMLRASVDYPAAASFGGRVQAMHRTPPPSWIDEGRLAYFGAFDLGSSYTLLAYPHFPRGCNMMLRRSALGGMRFDPLFGKRGRRQSCYEEIDLCWRLERTGYESVYVPEARVQHVIRADRHSARWFNERVFEQGKGVRLFERRNGIPRERRMIAAPWRAARVERGMQGVLARGYAWGSILPIARRR